MFATNAAAFSATITLRDAQTDEFLTAVGVERDDLDTQSALHQGRAKAINLAAVDGDKALLAKLYTATVSLTSVNQQWDANGIRI